jgi:hypothetical protein
VIRRAVERAWGVRSRGHAGCESGARPGVALFGGEGTTPRLLSSPALPDTITISFDPESRAIALTPAGAAGTIVVKGAWRRLQIFVPQASVATIAAELGLPDGCDIEIAAGPIADDEIEARAAALLDQLDGKLPVSALQLDELALDMAMLLVTRHARVGWAGRVGGGASERALIEALVMQLRDSPDSISTGLRELLRTFLAAKRRGDDEKLN